MYRAQTGAPADTDSLKPVFAAKLGTFMLPLVPGRTKERIPPRFSLPYYISGDLPTPPFRERLCHSYPTAIHGASGFTAVFLSPEASQPVMLSVADL